VLAPIRSNRVDGARTGLAVADGAEVTTVADNEFTDIQQPDDGEVSDGTDETETGGGDGTEGTETSDRDDTEETTSGAATPSTTDPGDTATEAGDPGTSGSDGSTPGFGVGSALATLGGAGYLLHRRFADDDTESE